VITIPIDRKTIKKNPNAGNTQSVESLGPMTGTITVNEKHVLVEDIEGVRATQFWKVKNRLVKAEYLAYGEGFAKFMKRMKRLRITRVSYSLNYPHHVINHQPEPQYLFEYEPTELICSECKKPFLHSDIRNDVMGDGDGGEHYCDSVCPLCGAWDCVAFQYEKLDNVLKEINP
jgi:hypothetical protein